LHALQQAGVLTKASKNAGTRLEQQGLFLLPVMAADQVVNKAQEASSMEAIQQVQNQIANKTSRMLANRALDELARTPPRPPPQSASM
jgi:thiamine biosynthesis lipoprotein ApbE